MVEISYALMIVKASLLMFFGGRKKWIQQRQTALSLQECGMFASNILCRIHLQCLETNRK